jgi:hypothetical protein
VIKKTLSAGFVRNFSLRTAALGPKGIPANGLDTGVIQIDMDDLGASTEGIIEYKKI